MEEQTRELARRIVKDRGLHWNLELTHGAIEMLAMPISEDPGFQERLDRLGEQDLTGKRLDELAGPATVGSLDVLLQDIKQHTQSLGETRASSSHVVGSLYRNFCRIPPFCGPAI